MRELLSNGTQVSEEKRDFRNFQVSQIIKMAFLLLNQLLLKRESLWLILHGVYILISLISVTGMVAVVLLTQGL